MKFYHMEFNSSQKSAILHKDGPMMVLAGPGSGKTTVITHRIVNLIQNYHIPPNEILVITFTKAAAAEMKMRYERILSESEQTQRVTFGTFHAVYFTVLKLAYHFESSNVLDQETRYRLMRDILSRYHLDYEDETEYMESLFEEIGKVKTGRISIENYYSTTCGESVFRDIYRDYQNRLHENRKIDFDDMLLYTYKLFSQRKDILSAWQKKYRYILVDEFQDINQIQYDILRMLALPENNLFIVGDDDQSIYQFRGARPDIMLQFETLYPNAERVLLDTNYRSCGNIIKAAGNLISHNAKRFDKEIKGVKKAGKEPCVLTFQSQREEILYFIQELQKDIQNGRTFSEFAVLFRTNTQPRLLMELLMEYNIPFRSRDQIPNFYNHWICKDIFTYIRIARGSRKRRDFLRIMNRPKRYIGRDSLYGEDISFEVWSSMFEKQPWIAERIERLEYDLKMLAKMNPYAAINYIRKGIGYDGFLNEYAKYRRLKEEDLFEIADGLQESAKGFSTFEEWEIHIKHYEKEIRNQQSAKNEQTDAVVLATLHSAKGLEFHTVFIIDVNEGILPYKKAVLESDVEEERRLFYVGMTRAKERLFLSAVSDTKNRKAEPSRFLLEMINRV